MIVNISKIEDKARGKLLTATAGNFSVQILFLFHALERIETWGLTLEIVAETLLYPEEVVVGHRDRFIAHKRYGNHLIRAVYEYDAETPVLVTVYFPYASRYFEGGGHYEDKIF
jgi:hypothetical protein